MILIDTHTHLYLDDFKEDLDAVMDRADRNDVKLFMLPNIDEPSIPSMVSLCRKYPHQCLPMLGLHPCSVKNDWQEQLDRMKRILDEPGDLFPGGRIYGIGETGLDHYWDTTFAEEQQESLRIQAEWALEKGLPIILHTREAMEENISIIEEYHPRGLKGIFHCFAGTIEHALRILRMEGFYLGIGGVLTFKNSGLDKVVKDVPLERIVLETDSPYLAPAPMRGKRNESSFLRIIGEKLGEVKGIDLAEVAAVTTRNARSIFNLTE